MRIRSSRYRRKNNCHTYRYNGWVLACSKHGVAIDIIIDDRLPHDSHHVRRQIRVGEGIRHRCRLEWRYGFKGNVIVVSASVIIRYGGSIAAVISNTSNPFDPV